jgi:3,4-dihydroxy-2-butanone 4-phosphate synthase
VNEIDGKEHRWEMGRESVVAAIDAIRRGDMVVVTDDASRENEGDIIMAAEMATTEAMAFAVRYTGGVICIAMPEDRMRELELPPMLANNEDPKETAFTVTVDCNIDTSTGISAKDRAQTMRMLADPSASPSQFTRYA